MEPPTYFSSHAVQHDLPVGTLMAWRGLSDDAPMRVKLSTMGDYIFDTAPVVQVAAAARNVHLVANELHLTVDRWSQARPERSLTEIERLRELSHKLVRLLIPDAGERAHFIEGLQTCTVVQLQIEEATTLIPWNLLWFQEIGCWSGQIAMFRRSYKAVQRPISTRFDLPGCRLVGYAEYNRLKSARADLQAPPQRAEEYWAIDRLVGLSEEGLIDTLAQLEPGPLSKIDADRVDQWAANPRDLLHFNCHSEGEEEDALIADLRLRRDAIATNDNLKAVPPGSAVFLNVCRSTVHKLSDRHSLSATLHARSARAVCGTTHSISDRFATLFARIVYRELPKHDYNLFSAFRNAQLRLMEVIPHPMALFYVFEGDPMLTIGKNVRNVAA